MRKRLFVILLCIFGVFGMALVGVWGYHKLSSPKNDTAADKMLEISRKYDEVSYDEDAGKAYVNNEIVVIAEVDADKEDIEDLAQDNGAIIGEALEDINVYKFVFVGAYEYDELEELVDSLNESALVEEASISTVVILEEDTNDELEYEEAVYPSDPWGNQNNQPISWNEEYPEGINWGLEAINATAGWGYLEQINTVKVGIIDSMVDLSHEDLLVKNACASFTSYDTGENISGSINNEILSADEHGTHVAGTMVATWNNVGISGIMGDKGEFYYSVAYNIDSNNNVVKEYTTPYNYFKAIKALVEQDVQAINISQNTSRLIGFAASHGNENAISILEEQAEISGKLLKRLISNRQEQGKKDFVICIAAGNSNDTSYYVNEKALYGYEEVNPFCIFQKREIGGSLAKYNNYLSLIEEEEVKNRIIVVGSVGLSQEGYCTYSSFSNVGERVDIVAPGEAIYSLVPGGYDSFSGTSMATPHVTAAAGLAFGCNEELSGADVKKIVCASVRGRYYYEDGYSGLLNLEDVMRKGLSTEEISVNRVVNSNEKTGLDVCFVVDTTGSMGDDIANAKENMSDILEKLSEKTEDYRVALVDYRDFPQRSGSSEDYDAKIQLEFTNNNKQIKESIEDLDIGSGGDDEETVYSGLMKTLELGWREDAKKVIIIMGDAPPLDPEPYTEYTYEQIVATLYEADLSIDVEKSDDRVLGDAKESLINVYSIGIENSDDASDFFEEISRQTGGAFTDISDASEVSGAIIDSIEQVELTPLQTVTTSFGEEYSDETVELYDDDEFYFAYQLNENGDFVLDNMESGEYSWKIRRLNVKGAIYIEEEESGADIEIEEKWYGFVFVVWYRYRMEAITIAILSLIILIAIIIVVKKIKKKITEYQVKKKQHSEERAKQKEKEKARAQVKKTVVKRNFCPHCGHPLVGNEHFCGICGGKLDRLN